MDFRRARARGPGRRRRVRQTEKRSAGPKTAVLFDRRRRPEGTIQFSRVEHGPRIYEQIVFVTLGQGSPTSRSSREYRSTMVEDKKIQQIWASFKYFNTSIFLNGNPYF